MTLRFGTLPPSGEPIQMGKLIVVRSVRWSLPGFEMVREEARRKGLEPSAYVRQAAIRQAERDAQARERPRTRPHLGDGGE